MPPESMLSFFVMLKSDHFQSYEISGYSGIEFFPNTNVC
jgi:hypothetical protein